MTFFKKRPRLEYDPEVREPAVRRSICTGEMTAGFIDRQTGKFHELMRLEDTRALEAFCESVGQKEVKTIY